MPVVGVVRTIEGMRSLARRLGPLGLVLLFGVSLVPVASAAVAMPSDAAVSAAETSALTKINDQRVSHGLVKLRLDGRLAALARERAVYMAENDLLSHTHAGGLAVWDLMSAQGIAWYGAGEIIALNTTSNLTSSATTAVKSWLGSPPHKSIMLSTQYNYIGMGVAVSPTTGRRYWAGVFLKGPDRTGARATITSVSKANVSSKTAKVRIRWTGADTKLQILTSGLGHFQTSRRMDAGAWSAPASTTGTSTTRSWARGHVFEFRVRAIDKKGNAGSWKVVTVRT